MSSLAERSCVPCRGGTPPLDAAQQQSYLSELESGWTIVAGHHLERSFAFPDFGAALAFTNRIGDVAEAEQHHPDILLRWGEVRVTLWTHAIDGLSESDFVLAAKIDRVRS
jgi:4a-hydroxytetrahydrobiopterin dehydratase